VSFGNPPLINHLPVRRNRRHPGRHCASPKDQGYCHAGPSCKRAQFRCASDWRLLDHCRSENRGVAVNQGLHDPTGWHCYGDPPHWPQDGANPLNQIAATFQSAQDLARDIDQALSWSAAIHLAERFAKTSTTPLSLPWHALSHAMEGALKLKEISYIHARSYAAGELKHGPLAWR